MNKKFTWDSFLAFLSKLLFILTTLILLQLLTLTNSNLDQGPGRSPGGGWGAEPPKKEKKTGGWGGGAPPQKIPPHIFRLK